MVRGAFVVVGALVRVHPGGGCCSSRSCVVEVLAGTSEDVGGATGSQQEVWVRVGRKQSLQPLGIQLDVHVRGSRRLPAPIIVHFMRITSVGNEWSELSLGQSE